jgi:hypothetical protein
VSHPCVLDAYRPLFLLNVCPSHKFCLCRYGEKVAAFLPDTSHCHRPGEFKSNVLRCTVNILNVVLYGTCGSRDLDYGSKSVHQLLHQQCCFPMLIFSSSTLYMNSFRCLQQYLCIRSMPHTCVADSHPYQTASRTAVFLIWTAETSLQYTVAIEGSFCRIYSVASLEHYSAPHHQLVSSSPLHPVMLMALAM